MTSKWIDFEAGVLFMNSKTLHNYSLMKRMDAAYAILIDGEDVFFTSPTRSPEGAGVVGSSTYRLIDGELYRIYRILILDDMPDPKIQQTDLSEIERLVFGWHKEKL